MSSARMKAVASSRKAARAADHAAIDPTWTAIRSAAEELVSREPALANLAHTVILAHDRLEDALSYRFAQKLGGPEISPLALRELADAALYEDPDIAQAARADIGAVVERDPACKTPLQPLLFFKGFQAIQTYRIAHWCWRNERIEMASMLQMRMTEAFSIDIHPGARIGRGVMIDHGTGVVIGETAVVGDDVSMLQGVTLGGTGKESGDRHPKIRRGVLIGANASILGNIVIGECSRVGAGSVVLHDVPPCKTVAGVPAKIVGDGGCKHPSRSMNHVIS